jgi:hypothetical protein
MSEEYDRERTAALIKEAQQITADLKVETEEIKIEVTRILNGDEGEDVLLDEAEAERVPHHADLLGATPPKSFWR